ncbi:MAG: glycosyl hydrolase [Planctomycetes bacterium]|nr:glycosyl hydrolase [Planctomycetota bacterium]
MAREIIVVPHIHFDPTWRRCFDRRAHFNDVCVRSYVEVEEICFDAWLRLADRGHTFSEGQVAILRAYLARNPQRRDELRRHAASGNLNVMMAGETVQDSTLPTAEGLVRNFLVAWPFYHDLVGDDHPALKLAWLEDAFGNSPNYPQVLKGVGCEVACHTSYRRCPEDVWVGIDGTMIDCYDHYPVAAVGGFEKQPPCDHCRGHGCATCGGSGLTLCARFDIEAVRAAILAAVAREGDWCAVWIGTEEILPDPRIGELMERMRADLPAGTILRFGNQVDIYRLNQTKIAATRATRDPAQPTIDLNPAMPGCYVSRIRTKQRTRAVSYLLCRAEAALAQASWASGTAQAPPADLARAWQLTTFNQFHDAITGTHIDSAYTELMDMLDEAERIAQGHLPAASVVPPVDDFRPVGPGTIALGALQVTYDLAGITAITRDGIDVFGPPPRMVSHRRPMRIGELGLEADFGDAWGKRIEDFGGVVANLSTVLLGAYHDAVEAAPGAIRWRGTYRGGDPKVARLAWTVTARASSDGQRIDFSVSVDWDTASRRLRVLVPVAAQDDVATYEVPFGSIARGWDASKLSYSQWNGDQREFPALHWVRKDIDARRGVALLNRGLPCNRWLPGRLELSLLRSPEWAFCSVEPVTYEFWDIDGQRDTGRHQFDYSLWPFVSPLGTGDLVRAGYAYNDATLTPPFAIAGDVVVTAWKPAEDGRGWILRVQDAGGVGTALTLDFARSRRVTRCDLLERAQGSEVDGARWHGSIHRHGIMTLRIA